MTRRIIVNSYAKERHTPGSGRSFYLGSTEDLLKLVDTHFDNQGPGFRPGVVIVSVPPENFFSGTVQLTSGDQLGGEFVPRRKGEAPRKHHWCDVDGCDHALPIAAVSVGIVLYSSVVLAEDGDNELPIIEGEFASLNDNRWEVISINATIVDGVEPIHPDVLSANHFGLDGGTATKMSDQEYADQMRISVPFWVDKSKAMPKEKGRRY